MNKILSVLLISLTVFLTACSGSSTTNSPANQAPATQANQQEAETSVETQPTAASATTTNSSSAVLNTDYENAVSIESQLVIGTLKLNSGDQALTKDQATALIPLWTNLKTITESMMPQRGQPGADANSTSEPQTTNTETQSKIDALMQQIQAIMTPEQLKAIADMKITQESAITILQDQGVNFGGPRQGENGDQQAPQGNPPADGQQPQGTPPADGQQPQGTPQAGGPNGGPQGGQMQRMGQNFLPTQWIDAVIQSLAKITGDVIPTSTAPASN
jgi:hypothetical protein